MSMRSKPYFACISEPQAWTHQQLLHVMPMFHQRACTKRHGYLQVNRLELALSIGSFAAAIGAVVAGIFGMNLKSTFEESIIGFWGTTAAIILGCVLVFFAIFAHTRRRRIL